MITFLEYMLDTKQKTITESAISDKYEHDVAERIQLYSDENNLGWTVERPKVGTNYSDVRVQTIDGKTSWIEVKMNITDQLGTPRFFYKDEEWQSNMHTPIAIDICNQLNSSIEAQQFIDDLSKFVGIDKNILYLSPFKSEIKKEQIDGLVTLSQLNEFAKKHGRYIVKQDPYKGIDKVLAKHYLYGKAESAQYVQIGDNFLMLDKKINPLKFIDVPTIKGDGMLNVRFTTRSEFYEIQAEIKFSKISFRSSPYSFKPNSTKPTPIAEK